jgi:hypothetical protein
MELDLDPHLGRLRVLVNGSYTAAQCTTNQEPTAEFRIGPLRVLARE